MGRALSEDLRWRVVLAIEDGMSTRDAARRFGVGLSTPGAWHRLWRKTGDVRPGRQGQPPGSKLDAHEAFILDLIAKAKDIALAEIAERLVNERGVSACPATIWYFFDARGITYKKRLRTPANRAARML